MLTLPIKRKWFDMILSGEKKEEYREIKPYYESRLPVHFGYFFRNGELQSGYIFNAKLQSMNPKSCSATDTAKLLPHSLQSVRCQSELARKNGEQKKEKSILY